MEKEEACKKLTFFVTRGNLLNLTREQKLLATFEKLKQKTVQITSAGAFIAKKIWKYKIKIIFLHRRMQLMSTNFQQYSVFQGFS